MALGSCRFPRRPGLATRCVTLSGPPGVARTSHTPIRLSATGLSRTSRRQTHGETTRASDASGCMAVHLTPRGIRPAGNGDHRGHRHGCDGCRGAARGRDRDQRPDRHQRENRSDRVGHLRRSQPPARRLFDLGGEQGLPEDRANGRQPAGRPGRPHRRHAADRRAERVRRGGRGHAAARHADLVARIGDRPEENRRAAAQRP